MHVCTTRMAYSAAGESFNRRKLGVNEDNNKMLINKCLDVAALRLFVITSFSHIEWFSKNI